MRIRVSVSLNRIDLERLDILIAKTGFNRSLVIRQLIKDSYEQLENGSPSIRKELSK